MLRQLLAVLVSSAFVLGSVSTGALSGPARNQSPLPPAGAAGIKQAQGEQIDPLLASGIVVGIFLIGVLLIGDNDDDDDGTATTTTGTN